MFFYACLYVTGPSGGAALPPGSSLISRLPFLPSRLISLANKSVFSSSAVAARVAAVGGLQSLIGDVSNLRAEIKASASSVVFPILLLILTHFQNERTHIQVKRRGLVSLFDSLKAVGLRPVADSVLPPSQRDIGLMFTVSREKDGTLLVFWGLFYLLGLPAVVFRPCYRVCTT